MRLGLFVSVVGVLLGSAAAAQAPKITLGGIIHTQAGYSSQESSFDAGTRHQGFRSDTEVHVQVEGETERGLRYGATIELEADTTADTRGEGLNADKTYLWLEYGLGRWELGNNAGVDQTMVVNAASIAVATGGIDGDDEFFINSSGRLGTARFLTHPDLPTADTGGIAEDASKITWYSGRFHGLQAGISYTPDEGDGGQIAARNDTNGDAENVVAIGLNYEREWDGYSLAAALVGEMGSAEAAGTEDVRAWQAGATLGFDNGISIAASYGDWDDSGMPKAAANADTHFWTLGAAYALNDNAALSATYFDSDRAGNDYESLGLGGEYSLAPGLTPYAEISFFEADEAGAGRDNDGAVLLVGTYLNF